MQELIIIRGPSGSGKSTFAERLAWLLKYSWFETDMFFVKDGQYLFDPQKLGQAHVWCRVQVGKALGEGHSVIVSNTFTRIWEMQPYIDMAKEFNARLTVLHMENKFGNVHGLSEEQVQKQRDRWEPYNG